MAEKKAKTKKVKPPVGVIPKGKEKKEADSPPPACYNLKFSMSMALHERMKTAATIEGISQNEWLRKLIDKHAPKL